MITHTTSSFTMFLKSIQAFIKLLKGISLWHQLSSYFIEYNRDIYLSNVPLKSITRIITYKTLRIFTYTCNEFDAGWILHKGNYLDIK